jgi:enoyl-CoA hydratase
MNEQAEILFERRGAAGIVTLNRPQALNAVTHAMVRALDAQLRAWAQDPAIACVIVTAAGQKAFSAGGDIRVLWEMGRDGRQEEALTFWREEYHLNSFIKHYPKPYVALIDGIVMGGGVGVSIHGSHRVAGNRYQFAMPEVGIGFFPDVGASWFLPRMPGETGAYLALTGDRARVADAVTSGLATHAIPSERWPDLIEGLCGTVPVGATLNAFAATPDGTGPLSEHRALIDRVFAANSVEDILAGLDREVAAGSEFAKATAALMRTKSPTSLKIALKQMREGRDVSFNACMNMEFRIVNRVVYGKEFYEGVRATIIDKDQKPAWSPAQVADVTGETVAAFFAPLGAQELGLP